MAIHQLITSVLARARGDHAIAVAARYSGEILRDHRTGILYDGSPEADVVYREIMGSVTEAEPAWWRDRETLWNVAEQQEMRSNSRVARDWLLGLPHELEAAARIDLARAWGIFIATRYGVAVDLSVHRPPGAGDPRNHYARLLSTTRQVTSAGLGAKVGLELSNGPQSGPRELRLLHEHWNGLLHAAISHAPIDQARSLDPGHRVPVQGARRVAPASCQPSDKAER